jgi:hypothetical protein
VASEDEPGRLVLELDAKVPWSADIADFVEDIANDALRRDLMVTTRAMRLDEALLSGALHPHDSTRTDTARVVEIGVITLVYSGVAKSGRLRIEAVRVRGPSPTQRRPPPGTCASATAGMTRQQLMTLIARLDTADVQTIDLTADVYCGTGADDRAGSQSGNSGELP